MRKPPSGDHRPCSHWLSRHHSTNSITSTAGSAWRRPNHEPGTGMNPTTSQDHRWIQVERSEGALQGIRSTVDKALAIVISVRQRSYPTGGEPRSVVGSV